MSAAAERRLVKGAQRGSAEDFEALFALHWPRAYQGGFVVDGPRCATLEAWVDGASEPERRVVSFGSGDCGA